MRRTVIVLLLAGVVLTGCGPAKKNNGIGTVAGTSSAAPSKLGVAEAGRQFAQCMREHGVQIPDPELDENGAFDMKVEDPNSDPTKIDAAMKACQKYLPGGGEMGKPNPEMLAQMRKMAECMRANGVPDFPDPDPDSGGGVAIETDQMDSQETFERAMKKCDQYGPKGDVTTTEGSVR
ncbi:hypothetical protein [Salinispora arenicola]|uniref:hypothetical protein n=1 Tax=Salinispora arenicola TaxID=168697 RepID=UPI0027DB4F78|nr:hypothetical protein [Salinispora arenicola]